MQRTNLGERIRYRVQVCLQPAVGELVPYRVTRATAVPPHAVADVIARVAHPPLPSVDDEAVYGHDAIDSRRAVHGEPVGRAGGHAEAQIASDIRVVAGPLAPHEPPAQSIRKADPLLACLILVAELEITGALP